MEKGKWTDAQYKAITHKNSNILVSAAAGSGKTAVLVERIINIISDENNKVDIDKLLVLTFTRAAASQMKDRIGVALSKKIAINPENDHLLKQLTLLNKAPITTIDSFCLRLVKENYMHIDMDPNFRTADESENELIKNQVLEELFEEKYGAENNDGFLQLVESYGEDTGDKKLKALVLEVYNFVQSNPFPSQWLNNACNNYIIEKDFLSSFWGKYIVEDATLIIKDLILKINEAKEICTYADGPSNYMDGLMADEDSLVQLKLLLTKDFNSFVDAVNSFKMARLKAKNKDADEVLVDRVKDLREQIKKAIADLCQKYFFEYEDEIVKNINSIHTVAKELSQLVEDFIILFKQAKKEKLLMDYSDMEHYALEILLEEGSTVENPIPSPVALELQKKYYEVMTDEYQDSNMVQELLLLAVSGKNKNRFMVGDVKQSIYRFRQAQPLIFMEKYNSYGVDGDEVRIDLSKNFRSRKNILNSINFVFMQLMSENLGELKYDKDVMLIKGGNFPHFEEEKEQEPVELHIINRKALEEGEQEEELDSAELEMTFVAKKINQLIETKFKVLDEDGTYRPIRYNDIVILMRAQRGWSEVAKEALENAGVPVYTQSNSKYYEKPEISTILSFLKIIDNPRQDIPLLTVLKSPVYNFTDDQLVEIKLLENKDEFYDNIVVYKENGEDKEIVKKITSFFDDLKKWRDMVPNSTVNSILWTIYNETGYFDYVGVRLGGKVRQANLRLLCEKADQLEKTSLKGLFNFIKYVEKLEESETSAGEASVIGENENVVRIMTIHKSKGLEFPVVFLCGLGKRFNAADMTKPVIMHEKLGYGLEAIDLEKRAKYNTVIRNVIKDKIKKENLSEEMRVLYVALTRAKEKLILVGSVRNLESSITKWCGHSSNGDIELWPFDLLRAGSYIEWIAPALIRHRAADCMKNYITYFHSSIIMGVRNHSSNWKVYLVERDHITAYIKGVDVDNIASNITEEIDLKEQFKKLDFSYSYSTDIPANISISEIKRNYSTEEDNYETTIFKKPKMFSDTAEKLTAAQKGTALHTIMQFLDLRKDYTEKDVIEEIEKAVYKNLLSKEEASTVSVKKVMSFLNSSLGKRIKKSTYVRKEMPFAMELSPVEVFNSSDYENIEDNILVHGIIDCFFEENGKIILLDYKTDYIKNKKDLAEKYKIQLGIYKKAIEQINNKAVEEVYIYSLYLDEEIKIF